MTFVNDLHDRYHVWRERMLNPLSMVDLLICAMFTVLFTAMTLA